MKILKFNDFEEFACDVADKFDSIKKLDEYNDVAIIAKYEEARRIIKELLCIGYDLRSIDIHDSMFDGYDDEFIISVSNAECENEIYCEPMLRENGYLTDESTIIYVLDNCSSKVLSHCDSEIIYEVAIMEEDCDENCGCDGCQCACKEESKHIATSTASYTVNGKPVTKEEFDKKYEEFENKYLDNVRDMLLNYCEFMDEMSEWCKMFRW